MNQKEDYSFKKSQKRTKTNQNKTNGISENLDCRVTIHVVLPKLYIN